MTAPLIEIRDLHVSFAVHGGRVPAVRGASFKIPAGGTVALVGESGSGKTVVSQTLMGILPNNAVIERGEILFRDPEGGGAAIDLAAEDPDGERMQSIRGGRISIIFQEPMTSLSPLHTIGDQIGEALSLHRAVGRRERDEAVADMLRHVGFPDPVRALRTYPFELSGGLRQRAMIAMALVCRPALLVADEPTTALDVTIQAQILQLIHSLQAEFHMAVLMITHDLGVVRQRRRRSRRDVPRRSHGNRHDRADLRRSPPPLPQGPDEGGAALRYGPRRTPDPAARNRGRFRASHGPNGRPGRTMPTGPDRC